MAQIKPLKINSDGLPQEVDSASDDLTLASFTVTGGAVLSASGLDMNNTDISDVQDLVFTSPATGTINQTAGSLIVDNIMAKDRENLMTTAAGIAFPVVSDSAGQVDSFRLPALAGAPTASPTNGGEGHMVWDSTNNAMYVWDGSVWKNQSLASEAESVVNNVYVAEVAILAKDFVYISSANNVSPAIASSDSSARVVGSANAAAAPAAQVSVKSEGIVTGLTGLTAGARYYLSASVAGGYQTGAPTGAGNNIVSLGFAKNTTDMHLQLQFLGKRA